MNSSTDRFLTTHTGSLPRPPALLDLVFAQQDGGTVDAVAFDREAACGISALAGSDGARQPDANEREGAHFQGRPVAELASGLNR